MAVCGMKQISIRAIEAAVCVGYTLCFGGVGTHVLNGAMLPITYDVRTDFDRVALLATAQLLIVARKATPGGRSPSADRLA